MMYPLVLDLAADGVPVTVTCRVLGFTKQAFYQWKRHPVTARDWDDAHLVNAAVDIHHDDPGFGYRFIADEMPSRGITAGRNRVARLCSQQQIFSPTPADGARAADRDHRFMTTSSNARSLRPDRTSCG